MTQQESPKGRILAVLGLKGGVGKTTLAVNLGVGLAKANSDWKTVIVDGKLFAGDVAPTLNVRDPNDIIELARLAQVPDGLDGATLDELTVSHDSGARLVLGPSFPRYPAGSAPPSAAAIGALLDSLSEHYHYVVVDTGTIYDDVLSTIIEATDDLLLVTTPHFLALWNGRTLLNTLAKTKSSLDDLVVVVNQYDNKGRVRLNQIENYLKRSVDFKIPLDFQANEASLNGTPLIDMDHDKVPSAKALQELVEIVAERFPVEKIKLGPTPVSAGQSGTPPYTHPQRSHVSVLIVDDETSMQDMVQLMLELDSEDLAMDVQVAGNASDGLEAIELAGKLLPDVILMDVNMPNMDGLTATRRIRHLYPSIAVIIVTVQDDIEYWRRAMRSDVSDFIPKPDLGARLGTTIKETYERFEKARLEFR